MGRAPALCCPGAQGEGRASAWYQQVKGRVAGAPPSPLARAPEAENTRPSLPSGPSELGNLSLKSRPTPRLLAGLAYQAVLW